jgi:hypothetical protein
LNAEAVIRSTSLIVDSINGPALIPNNQSVITEQTPQAGDPVSPGSAVNLVFQAVNTPAATAASDVSITNTRDFTVVCFEQAVGSGSWNQIDTLDSGDSMTFIPASGVTYLLAAVSDDATQGCNGSDPSTADSYCVVSQTGVTGGGQLP